MKVTNKNNLPEPFVNAVRREKLVYNPHRIRVTELISPPKIGVLRRRHWEEIETDVMDNFWSLLGQGVHRVLELAGATAGYTEERLIAEVDGIQVSGTIDLHLLGDNAAGVLDYKVTSVWAAQQEKLEWEQQLNLYAWLVEKVKGVPVNSIKIVAILRDWARREALRDKAYPEHPVLIREMPLWPQDKRESYVMDRLAAHMAAREAAALGEQGPDCTPEERWQKPSTWAVKKEGQDRAVRTYDNKRDAFDYYQSIPDKSGYSIVERPGKSTRCEAFCQAAPWCNQYKGAKPEVKVWPAGGKDEIEGS